MSASTCGWRCCVMVTSASRIGRTGMFSTLRKALRMAWMLKGLTSTTYTSACTSSTCSWILAASLLDRITTLYFLSHSSVLSSCLVMGQSVITSTVLVLRRNISQRTWCVRNSARILATIVLSSSSDFALSAAACARAAAFCAAGPTGRGTAGLLAAIQGCFCMPSIVRRSCGAFLSTQLMKSVACTLNLGDTSKDDCVMLKQVRSKLGFENGGKPCMSSYVMIPMAHTSTFSS
mmetsp:Transcript_38459/g.73691  ORF Transcript_38459/g.73691 Transcript_38459/m.73691 type:complete len:234 (+) Transcript_38459:928-1629(+)